MSRDKILIVDDEQSILSQLKWGLSEEFDVLTAATAEVAVRLLREERPAVVTLDLALGVRGAAYTIAPFFVIPWLLMPVGTSLGILTGNHVALVILGVLLALWGVYTLWLIVRNPDELTATENHPSWRHMYLMMMAAQIGFAIAYVV